MLNMQNSKNEDCWKIIKKYKRFFRMGASIAVIIIILLIFTSIVVVTELTKKPIYSILGLPVSCFTSLILLFALLIVIYMVDRKSTVRKYIEGVVKCIDEYFLEGKKEFENLETGKGSAIIEYKNINWLIIPQVNSFIVLKYQKEKILPFIVGIQTILKLKRKGEEIVMDRDLRFFQSRTYTTKKYRGKLIWGNDERMVKLSKNIVDYLVKNFLRDKVQGINTGILNDNDFLIFNIVIPESRREFELILNGLADIVGMIENYENQ